MKFYLLRELIMEKKALITATNPWSGNSGWESAFTFPFYYNSLHREAVLNLQKFQKDKPSVWLTVNNVNVLWTEEI